MIDALIWEYICCPYDQETLLLVDDIMICDACKRRYKIIEWWILSIMPDENEYNDENWKLKKIEEQIRDEQVDVYDNWFWTYTNAIEYNSCIDSLELNRNDILVDIWCWIWRYTINYASLCKKVIAIDHSIKSLFELQARLKLKGIDNVYLIHADLTYLPIKKSCVHKIVSNQVLSFIPWSEARNNLIKKLYDALHPNWKIVLTVFNYHLYRKAKAFLWVRWVFNKEGLHPIHGFYYYNYSSSQMKVLIRQSWFEMEKIVWICNFPREYVKDLSSTHVLYKVDNMISKTPISYLLWDLLIATWKKK